MSVTSSRLRHHGMPGLQAQKWLRTENTTASPIVIGTTFSIVWPSISMTSRGRLDMGGASPDQLFPRGTLAHLRSRERQPPAAHALVMMDAAQAAIEL